MKAGAKRSGVRRRAAAKALATKRPLTKTPGGTRAKAAGNLQTARLQKAIAEKDSLIRKLKGQLAEKEKEVKDTRKGFLEQTKESLLQWKAKAEEQTRKLRAQLEAAKGGAQGKGVTQSLVDRLKRELEDKEDIIRQSEKTLREAIGKVGKEVSAIKERTNQTLSEWRAKADAENKKLKADLQEISQALTAKEKELDACRKGGAAFKPGETPGPVLVEEKERAGLVTFKGNPLTLIGEEIKVGDRAPDFRVVDNDLKPVTLESYKGKVKIISSVPSLDTPVCDMETRRFNQEADKLPGNVALLTISMDLPFAQKRWCAAAGVEKVKTFSDFQHRSFGCAYGVLTKELRLLARAVFIVDEQDVIRYVELVPEIAQEPQYDRVLEAVRALAS